MVPVTLEFFGEAWIRPPTAHWLKLYLSPLFSCPVASRYGGKASRDGHLDFAVHELHSRHLVSSKRLVFSQDRRKNVQLCGAGWIQIFFTQVVIKNWPGEISFPIQRCWGVAPPSSQNRRQAEWSVSTHRCPTTDCIWFHSQFMSVMFTSDFAVSIFFGHVDLMFQLIFSTRRLRAFEWVSGDPHCSTNEGNSVGHGCIKSVLEISITCWKRSAKNFLKVSRTCWKGSVTSVSEVPRTCWKRSIKNLFKVSRMLKA